MAVPNGIKVPAAFEYIFPAGAMFMGVEPVTDFDRKAAGAADDQARDKETGERVWQVTVIDNDDEASKFGRSPAVKVKITSRRAADPLRQARKPRAHPGVGASRPHCSRHGGATHDPVARRTGGGVMAGRRQFGKVRKLPSGRFQASFVGPTGERQYAPNTFLSKADAGRWLARAEADLSRGTWVDERAGSESLGSYARAVLRDSPKIGVRWRETCERNLRLHLAPLVDVRLRALSPTQVREWHAAALRGTGGRTSISQSYRFLRMVMNTAVREGLVARNPCQVPGAGTVKSAERPVASPAQILQLVEAINERYRTAVLIAAWCGIRRGEIAGLRVEDVDLVEHTITVRKNRVEPLSAPHKAFDGDPKTEAGKRTIAIPPHVVPVIRLHLERYAGRERLFVSRDGSPLRGNSLYQAFVRARVKAGLTELAFHDLRHTGQTLAAQTGATMADLMKRLGHSTMVAARRYLHAVDGRDRAIANALSTIAMHGDPARLPNQPARPPSKDLDGLE